MELIKIESKKGGIWYFTRIVDLTEFLCSCYQTMTSAIARGYYKEWSIEQIDSDDVLTKFINPNKKGLKAYEK